VYAITGVEGYPCRDRAGRCRRPAHREGGRESASCSPRWLSTQTSLLLDDGRGKEILPIARPGTAHDADHNITCW
jgi:hypothetical protein